MKKWENLTELGEMILARGKLGRTVHLAPETAYLVGLKLMTADAKPSHAEVLKMICDSKCERGCVPCSFKANAIVRAYGQGGGLVHGACKEQPTER